MKKTMASTWIDGKTMEKLRDWTMMKKWRKTMEKNIGKKHWKNCGSDVGPK